MVFSISLRSLGLAALLMLESYAAITVDKLMKAPIEWSLSSSPSGSKKIVLQAALSFQNIDQLDSKLLSVASPSSPDYGQYFSAEQVNSLFGASSQSFDVVSKWLSSNGVRNYKQIGSSIWFETTVDNANSLLGANFQTFQHADGTKKLRTLSYSVPDTIMPHVDFFSPTTFFGSTQAKTASSQPDALEIQNNIHASLSKRANGAQLPDVCNTTITYAGRAYSAFDPQCINIQYNVHYQPSASSGSKIGFGSFLNQSAGFQDLADYLKYFKLPSQNFSVALVNPQDGATELPQPPIAGNSGEANLDVQNIASLVYPLPITEFITAGSPPYFPDPSEPAGTPNQNEPYVPYYEYLLQQDDGKLPQVISNSYGENEQTVPYAYAMRTCQLIGQLGMRGITVIHSSGDAGVGAACQAQNATNKPQFNPIFPATCPYVTAVGGTVNWQPEIAWKGSSGGFSGYWKRPFWQEAAVAGYLSQIPPGTKKYYSNYVDLNGRGFPDVAAHSVTPDYSIFEGGILTPSGGTSAAAPVVASLIALVNDSRLRKGKPVLGFLNPLIYSILFPSFTDITAGQSIGCNGNNTQTNRPVPGAGVIPGAFWNATKGWDPVTGWGTPDLGKLLRLVG